MHVAGHELLPDHPERRGLVHLEPDAVAEPVVEAVLEHLTLLLRQQRRKAALGEELGDEAVDVAAVHAWPDLRVRELERLAAERVPLADLVRRHVADRERARDVREAAGLDVDREEVEEDDVVAPDRRPTPCRARSPVCGPCETIISSDECAVREEGRLDPLLRVART